LKYCKRKKTYKRTKIRQIIGINKLLSDIDMNETDVKLLPFWLSACRRKKLILSNVKRPLKRIGGLIEKYRHKQIMANKVCT